MIKKDFFTKWTIGSSQSEMKSHGRPALIQSCTHLEMSYRWIHYKLDYSFSVN